MRRQYGRRNSRRARQHYADTNEREKYKFYYLNDNGYIHKVHECKHAMCNNCDWIGPHNCICDTDYTAEEEAAYDNLKDINNAQYKHDGVLYCKIK